MPVPAHDGIGLDDLHGLAPIRSQLREQHPQPAIDASQPRASRSLTLEHGELMAEGENFGFTLEARPKRRPDSGEEGDEERGHDAADRISLGA